MCPLVGVGWGQGGWFAVVFVFHSALHCTLITFTPCIPLPVMPRSLPPPPPPAARPAGVDSGFQLRLEGVTPAGPKGSPPAGDLLVQLEVAPSPRFQRQEWDLYVEATIDVVDACLGTTVE